MAADGTNQRRIDVFRYFSLYGRVEFSCALVVYAFHRLHSRIDAKVKTRLELIVLVVGPGTRERPSA